MRLHSSKVYRRILGRDVRIFENQRQSYFRRVRVAACSRFC